MAPPVRITALGGLGEIGMNCMVAECDGHLAVVDCGVLFPNEPLGIELIAPDLSWLRERRDQVDAVFLTHGHEDHIGALPLLLRDLQVPVYGSRLTLALARQRLAEAGVKADLCEVRPGEVRQAKEGSPFSVEFIAVTHSIPDSLALALFTPQGTILHSGDFKIDPRPLDGRLMDLPRIEALGQKGVRLLLSDSTNSEKLGASLSETEVGPTLSRAFEEAKGLIFAACFSSNLHRIQQIANAARAEGRRLAVLGRSLEQNVRLALELGYLQLPAWQLVSAQDARDLPPRELCVLTSGTQGEPRSALARLARGDHSDLKVRAGDLVILSSRYIPGNEIAIGKVVNGLCRLGARVLYDEQPPLHVSGHAQADEQQRLIALARPEHFVPIHGEFRHLARHAAHAAAAGVPEANCHLMADGEILELDDDGVHVLAEQLPTGRVYADRDAEDWSDIGALVIRDRRLLAEAGLCILVLAVDKASGAVVRGPEVFGRGVAAIEGFEAEIGREALEALGDMTPQARADIGEVQEALRVAVRRWFKRERGKKPAVLPVVLEL